MHCCAKLCFSILVILNSACYLIIPLDAYLVTANAQYCNIPNQQQIPIFGKKEIPINISFAT